MKAKLVLILMVLTAPVAGKAGLCRSLEGRIVSFDKEEIRVKPPTGAVIVLKQAQLSPEDREFLKKNVSNYVQDCVEVKAEKKK